MGVSPDKGAAFIERLVSRDDGWLASYFDALSRISGPVKDYLAAPERLQRFYTAIRGRVTSPGPARPVFRANTDMLLLTTRLRLEPGGQPHIPGGIGVWRDLFLKYSPGRIRRQVYSGGQGLEGARRCTRGSFCPLPPEHGQ